MKKKAYKKSRKIYNAIDQMFNELNDCQDLGYIALERVRTSDSLPTELDGLIARCKEVLDHLAGTLTEEDFELLGGVEDFLNDNMPESIARKLSA